MKILLTITLVLTSTIYRANAITTTYMDDHCNDMFSVTLFSDLLLKVTRSSVYQSNMDCTVTIATSGIHLDQVMLKFRSMDISSSSQCKTDRLDLYDGGSTSSPSMTGMNGLCGSTTPSRVYTTTSDRVTVRFKSSSFGIGTGFTILLTAYTDGFCYTSDFMCDNLRCIKSYLTCDGYDNCGDNSDEEDGCVLSTGALAGVVIAGIGGTIFFIAMIVFGVSRRRAYYGRTIRATASPRTVTQTVTQQTMPQQPCYGYNQPAAPPPYPGQQQFSYPVQAVPHAQARY